MNSLVFFTFFCIVYIDNTQKVCYNGYMKRYPEEITRFRPKGTVIKKINNQYYVYEATSKRVPGKSYPVQVLGNLVGKIDTKGFIPFKRTVIEGDEVNIREAGFTNYLLLFENDFILNQIGNATSKKAKKHIYRNIIVYLSPSSYLNDEPNFKYENIFDIEKRYGFSLVRQLICIEELINQKLEDIGALKSICRVIVNNKTLKTTLTECQKELIKKLEVKEDDIR